VDEATLVGTVEVARAIPGVLLTYTTLLPVLVKVKVKVAKQLATGPLATNEVQLLAVAEVPEMATPVCKKVTLADVTLPALLTVSELKFASTPERLLPIKVEEAETLAEVSAPATLAVNFNSTH
jgi:hypothetical protein